MAFRGISLRFGSLLPHPGKNIEYVLVLLLYSTFGVMDMTIVVLITAKGAEGLCSNSIT
jgi:hypothetical protein